MILPGILSSQISGHLFTLTGSYDALATVTVPSGGASSITFSAIPQTYTHLQLRMTTRSSYASSASNGYVGFNSDTTGANYYAHALTGNGSSASASSIQVGSTTIPSSNFQTNANSSASNVFTATVFDILDYTSTNKNKVCRALNGYDLNGSGSINLMSFVWLNTSAINSIFIGNWDTGWNQNSQFTLYGIK